MADVDRVLFQTSIKTPGKVRAADLLGLPRLKHRPYQQETARIAVVVCVIENCERTKIMLLHVSVVALVVALLPGDGWCLVALERAAPGRVAFKEPTLDTGGRVAFKEPTLDTGISLQPIEAKLTSVVTDEFAAAQRLVDGVLASEKSFLASGVDRAVDAAVSGLESFANHLATSPEALDIGTKGEIFLAAASTTADRLRLSIDQLEKTTEGRPSLGLPIQKFCPFSSPPSCSSAAGSRYRTIDGSCNNVHHPFWGKAFTPFERFLPPMYDDMISTPRQTGVFGSPLPGARLISFTFHQPSNLADLMNDVSHYSMEWGQFISHDIQRNALSKGYHGSNLDCCANPLFKRPGCFPIDIPTTDPFFYAIYGRTCMNFVRAVPTPNLACSLGPRQQLNQNTHYLDGSQVYGSDKTTSDSLRTFSGGRMKSDSAPGVPNLLPKDVNNDANCILPAGNPNVKCFKAGDVRANQQPALISLHTIFMREHNRIAAILSSKNPSWNDQTLFDETRKIVGAMIQHVTYNEYLPDILGNDIMTSHDLNPKTFGFFNGYSLTTNGAIRNAFSAAAFRFGHSKVRDRMANPGGTSPNPLLKDVFLNPQGIYDTSSGIDGFTKGLIGNYAQKVDERVSTQLTRHLFERSPGFGGDLAAINIQRARDHGIPFYKMWRFYCGNVGPLDHHLLADLVSVYGNDIDIDLFTGGVSELPVPGGKVGPVFACLIAKQFQFLKKGDRYFYENSGSQAFEQGQLNEVRGTTMAKIICRNTGIATLQKNVFLKDVSASNPLIHCSTQSDIDFDEWQCAGWNPWGPYTQCFGGFKFRLRSCRNANPKPCVAILNPCPGLSFDLAFCGSGFVNKFIMKQVESALDRQLSVSPSLDKVADLDKVLHKAVDQGQRVFESFSSISKAVPKSVLANNKLRQAIP